MRPPRRVVVAPDSFKGAAGAGVMARALAEGLAAAWPDVQTVRTPLADGGEGTVAAVAAACPGAERTAPIIGPHGEPLQAGWWTDGDDLALVEMARAAGLGVTRRRDPVRASSFGVGQLMRAAHSAGARDLRVALGGSATVDGGAGALQALGFRLLDAQGGVLPVGAPDEVVAIEAPDEVLPGARIELLCDVDNPLCGPEGAARVFAPQKGADAAAVAQLARRLERWGGVLAGAFDRDPRTEPHAGAAGGLAAGLWAALGARMRSGFEAVAEWVDLDGALVEADLVLTGEGRVDEQTRRGKVPDGVLARCEARALPLWIFAGEVTEAAERAYAGRAALVPLADGPRDLEASLAAAPALARRAAERAARLWSLR